MQRGSDASTVRDGGQLMKMPTIRRMWIFLALAVSAISGCDFDPAAMNAKLTGLDAKLTGLDARVARLEAAAATLPTPPAVPTVLWVQDTDAYPRASAYFSSKEQCAASAAQWTFSNDKSAKLVSADPWVTQSGRRKDVLGQPARLTVSCLPQGVAPFTK